ncbi:unannotated protein [freshwater metagenome]|uniref:Unannotated protein n=1 Tax=freshwater metagenome TaxID=449393 RepID=A0A6J7IUY4_9ZZZZ|nr:hypothetical protein [Actinomycetota bacterium]
MSTEADEHTEDQTPAEEQAQAAAAQAPEAAAAPEVAVPEAPVDEAPAAAEPVAEAPIEDAHAVDESPAAEDTPAAQESPAADGAAAPKGDKPKRGKGRSRGRRPDPHKDVPRSRAPLPLDELRDASRATLETFGRDAVRESFQILSARERQDLSALVAQDEDHRPRARNIANGSLGAGRIDKAMSATIVSMAKIEDLWALTLDKELASQKLGRIREAKQRDQQRAKRNAERANRADRVSREDLAKAQDGSVGATIRIVTDEARNERRAAQKQAKAVKRESVLDKLGY